MYPLSSKPVYDFSKKAICNYVFMMPNEAGSSSSITVTFQGSEETNKNVQAYYATYLATKDDLTTTTAGDIMKKYDGKWERQYPTDPPSDDEKAAEYSYIQSRVPPANGEKR